MPSDEKVEKVARAIAGAYARRAWPHKPDVIDNWVNKSFRTFFDEARAALAAAEAGEQPVLSGYGDYTPVTIRAGTVASPPSEASREEREWLAYTMTVEPQEDGTWLATCPDLPGCIATADTPDVALSRLRDVQEGWLAVCHEREIKVPEPATAMSRVDNPPAGK